MSDVQELTRVERDASGPRTTFEDIEVGADLGTLEWSVEYSNVEGLAENDQDFHEWYVDSSPWGPPVVTPMATYPPVRVLFTKRFNVRGVFYEYESEFHRPIHYGQKVIITGRVIDKWIKRDREYVKYEAEGRSEDGTLLFTTRRAHALDYLPRTVPRSGEGVDSGIAR